MSRPTLYLMLGYPGAGKTTAAKLIASVTGAQHLWADNVRREVYQKPTYSHKENIELYNNLNKAAQKLLEQGKSVIFDTNFSFYRDRKHLMDIAQGAGARTLVLWVQTPKGLAKQRAVVDAHLHSNTRVLGHMPEDNFERISGNIEPPHDDEEYIELDGTKLTDDYVKQTLQSKQLF